jgi:hypothetical protein
MFSGRRQPSCEGTSRMTRECHVRICERLGVKFPAPTRQSRHFDDVRVTSALPLKADLHQKCQHVSKVPIGNVAGLLALNEISHRPRRPTVHYFLASKTSNSGNRTIPS